MFDLDDDKKEMIMLAIAIGTNQKCVSAINKAYDKNYENLSSCDSYHSITNSILESASYETSIVVRKALDLTLSDYSGKDSTLLSVIKKGYKDVLNTIESRKESLSYVELFKEYTGKDNVYVAHHMLYVARYLARKFSLNELHADMGESLKGYFYSECSDVELDSGGYCYYIAQKPIKREIASPSKRNTYILDVMSSSLKDEIRGCKNKHLLSSITGISFIMNVFFGDYRLFTSSTISERDRTLIFDITNDMYTDVKGTISSKTSLYMLLMYLYAFNKEYRSVRSKLESKSCTNIDTDVNSENEDKINQLEYELKCNRNKISELEKTVESLKVELAESKLKIIKAESNSALLEDKLAELKENSVLNDQYFGNGIESVSLEKGYTDLTEETESGGTDYIVNSLSEYKIVFVGGHTRLQDKLKKLIPSCTFIGTDYLSRDIGVIRNSDAVFICTWYMGHNLYHLAIKEVKANNVPMFYVPDTRNVYNILQSMSKNIDSIGLSSTSSN